MGVAMDLFLTANDLLFDIIAYVMHSLVHLVEEEGHGVRRRRRGSLRGLVLLLLLQWKSSRVLLVSLRLVGIWQCAVLAEC